jgi:hypothetical protein
MTQQEAFNTIKRVVDLSLQNGVIKTIEESKVVFDSLDNLFRGIDELEKTKEFVKQKDLEAQKESNVHEINR